MTIYLSNMYTDTTKYMIRSSNGNIFRVTGESIHHRCIPLTKARDAFFYLRINKRLCKQSRRRLFETLWRPLWRHCNVFYGVFMLVTKSITVPLWVETTSQWPVDSPNKGLVMHGFGVLMIFVVNLTKLLKNTVEWQVIWVAMAVMWYNYHIYHTFKKIRLTTIYIYIYIYI